MIFERGYDRRHGPGLCLPCGLEARAVLPGPFDDRATSDDFSRWRDDPAGSASAGLALPG
jgi:hypothetical protein